MLDPAICGYCRSGYCRSGVYRPDWERLLSRCKKVVTPRKMIVDGGVVKVDEGEWRVDVYTRDWARLLKAAEKVA